MQNACQRKVEKVRGMSGMGRPLSFQESGSRFCFYSLKSGSGRTFLRLISHSQSASPYRPPSSSTVLIGCVPHLAEEPVIEFALYLSVRFRRVCGIHLFDDSFSLAPRHPFV
jgi:hypothetical protein